MNHLTRRGVSRRLLSGLVAVVVCALAVQCSRPSQPSPTGPSNPNVPNTPNIPIPTPNVSEIFVGAGDIAICPGSSDRTANLLDNIGGTVFTLGDNAYPNGSRENFNECFAGTWGRHRGRIHATAGNHDYVTPGASEYFNYFGVEGAGTPGLGYYSFELGAWHIISLNSNFDAGVAVGAGSPQAQWLRADLAATTRKCVAAMWHHPLFSSGQNGSSVQMRDLFRILYDANADVVLTGHDHDYESFRPQTADGALDNARGIRQFVVGTGGIALTPFRQRLPNSEQQIADAHGVLKLTLNPESYQYEFITPTGIRDSGAVACH
jgi:acid phosphatase type 7